MGWATIKLKKLNATHLEEAVVKEQDTGVYGYGSREKTSLNRCDVSGLNLKGQKCDPFVRVYVDKKEILTTLMNVETEHFNVNRSVTSKKIQKNSTLIEIVVLDDDEKREPQIIMKASGTVDKFLQKPIHCSEPGSLEGKYIPPNCLEIDILWHDERDALKPEALNLEDESKNQECLQTTTVRKFHPNRKLSEAPSREKYARHLRRKCKRLNDRGTRMPARFWNLCKEYNAI